MKSPISATHPEIAAQLKDQSLGDALTYGSRRKVWWVCDRSHEWEATVRHRTISGTGCPYCVGKKVLAGYNDIGTLRPDIACELKDQSLATQLTVSSNKKVWWCCSHCSNEWEATVVSRTKGHGCPYCSGRYAIPGETDLGTLRPDIACELKDQSLATQLTVSSNKKVWWCCKDFGHEWEATVVSRTKLGRGCPYCVGKKVLAGFNDLGTLRPDIACELKDQSLASQLTVGSNKRVAWVCKDCENGWETTVVSRAGLGQGCPACAKYGFDQTKPAFIYLVSQPALHDEDAVVVKLGISNAESLEARLAKHARQGLTEVLSTQGYLWGLKALEKERDFKRYLRGLPSKYRVTKDELPDGYTEAFLSTAPGWQEHAA